MFNKSALKDKYDVIIIGAGIGGLTCGCYLAKRGLKVLIIEQHDKVGGCCSSFKKKGIDFDAGVHSLGSCREDGLLGEILNELGIRDEVSLLQKDPIDFLLVDNYKIAFKRNIKDTIETLCNSFPSNSKRIKSFFNLLNSFQNNTTYYKFHKKFIGQRFSELLIEYFKTKKLHSIFNILLLNIGVPAQEASALSGIMLYKEFIFDGGYYPLRGIQSLSDAFAKKFIEFGGSILLSHKVTSIKINNKKIRGAFLDNNDFIASRCIVSNCDARQTYFKLIENKHLSTEFANKVKKLSPGLSLFSVYLGINKTFDGYKDLGNNIWNFQTKNFDRNFLDVFLNRQPYLKEGVCCFLNYPAMKAKQNADIKTLVYLLVTASYKNKKYWIENKDRVTNNLIKRGEVILPGLSSSIVIKESATPVDIEKFTLNYRGATNGWAYTPKQVDSSIIKRRGCIKGLYFTGHWVNQPLPGGIPSVAFLGKKTAQLIDKI